METFNLTDNNSLLPPPWRLKEGGGYINDITKEISDVHPLERFLSNMSGETTIKSVTPEIEVDQRGREEEIDEFRCTWQELGLYGSRKTFGASIRFNCGDGRTTVKLDGVEGEWQYTTLEGPGGALTRHDLFIGAKVTLFGRHLTIASCNLKASFWIEEEGERLRARQQWMQDKLESVGAVPCVRRPTPKVITHITRKPTVLGCVNLRRLVNENARLGEQMAKIGLAHIL